jgi:glycosyltransferase involved in cell wall biosynthesis
MRPIAVNARYRVHRLTGMQRYAMEIASRFSDLADSVQPAMPLTGMAGHIWEQVCLPAAARGRVLWSPNNTGPLATYRQVCTIHDLIPLDNPEWFSPRFSAWCKWLMPKLVHQVAHIIAVSEFTKQRIVDRFCVRPGKVTVVPNGIDKRFSPRSSEEIVRSRAELGIPEGKYLLFVGSLEPRKNIGGLLQAWRHAAGKLSADTWLVVAGAKGRKQVFADAVPGTLPERVHLTGYVSEENLPALYSGALALVYPSLYEGFGLPPLEAMACGAPVVTSNTTSLPEVTGDAAILVAPTDPEQMGAAMVRIAGDPGLRGEMSLRGLAKASGYSWDVSARSTLKVLEAYM